ncbi:hypothetical protein GCM10009122_21990 [Fulvivirga kasyanovii]|uniref:Uncharacterized protein n=1 Tax=Fulvivirga kasyanovii TaxID=396812 RepID=A0ABW9RZH7_9BACT|nr:hypothetical protein [Fulvivirga kasyanovii]MTI28530.1 hypothetical protein [Fulvivirga kasyanovii]
MKKKINEMTAYRIKNEGSSQLKGKGIYKIIDSCNGNFGYYLWDSATGDCWDLLGNKMYTC